MAELATQCAPEPVTEPATLPLGLRRLRALHYLGSRSAPPTRLRSIARRDDIET
jgi:hypothetical protein